MIAEYKALRKKSYDQEQLPEPVERKQTLSAERVLKRISDEVCQLLGLNPKYARPDWLILQVFLIPPPPVRPSVMMDTSSSSEGRGCLGPDAARKFLGHTQWLVNYWLLQNAFSIGISDTIADASTMETINQTISQAKDKVKQLIREAQEKKLESQYGLLTKSIWLLTIVNQPVHSTDK
ncbi:DNA-directed RNA polymerase II subunit RPB1 [Trifolium repens]|nr:DNA-directed RNA polymerase II subunit RPB1 [Trifolium repens]